MTCLLHLRKKALEHLKKGNSKKETVLTFGGVACFIMVRGLKIFL